MIFNKTIYDDGNGGQLAIRNNDILTTSSLFTLAYLAMFGGNKLSNTVAEISQNELQYDWWGNYRSTPSSAWINSSTERVLTGIELNSQTIESIKQAVTEDVRFLSDFGELTVNVNIVSLNRVKISVTLNQEDIISIIWDNTINEVIEQV